MFDLGQNEGGKSWKSQSLGENGAKDATEKIWRNEIPSIMNFHGSHKSYQRTGKWWKEPRLRMESSWKPNRPSIHSRGNNDETTHRKSLSHTHIPTVTVRTNVLHKDQEKASKSTSRQPPISRSYQNGMLFFFAATLYCGSPPTTHKHVAVATTIVARCNNRKSRAHGPRVCESESGGADILFPFRFVFLYCAVWPTEMKRAKVIHWMENDFSWRNIYIRIISFVFFYRY